MRLSFTLPAVLLAAGCASAAVAPVQSEVAAIYAAVIDGDFHAVPGSRFVVVDHTLATARIDDRVADTFKAAKLPGALLEAVRRASSRREPMNPAVLPPASRLVSTAKVEALFANVGVDGWAMGVVMFWRSIARVRRAILIGLAAGLATLQVLLAQDAEAPKPGICEREGGKLAGSRPVRIGKGVPEPKKVRNVVPELPELPKGTIGSGMWIGEVLIGKDGSVLRVWTLRGPRLDPPLDDAIVAAVQAWEFEPLIVDSKPVAWCLTVTSNINWR